VCASVRAPQFVLALCSGHCVLSVVRIGFNSDVTSFCCQCIRFCFKLVFSFIFTLPFAFNVCARVRVLLSSFSFFHTKVIFPEDRVKCIGIFSVGCLVIGILFDLCASLTYDVCSVSHKRRWNRWLDPTWWWSILKISYLAGCWKLRLTHWPRGVYIDVRRKTSLVPRNWPTNQHNTGRAQDLAAAYWVALLYCSSRWRT